MGGRHAPPIRESRRQGKGGAGSPRPSSASGQRQQGGAGTAHGQGWWRQITKRQERRRRTLPAHTVELVPMCEAWPNLTTTIAKTAGCLGDPAPTYRGSKILPGGFTSQEENYFPGFRTTGTSPGKFLQYSTYRTAFGICPIFLGFVSLIRSQLS